MLMQEKWNRKYLSEQFKGKRNAGLMGEKGHSNEKSNIGNFSCSNCNTSMYGYTECKSLCEAV